MIADRQASQTPPSIRRFDSREKILNSPSASLYRTIDFSINSPATLHIVGVYPILSLSKVEFQGSWIAIALACKSWKLYHWATGKELFGIAYSTGVGIKKRE
jgi:hypothetical protein